MDFAYDEQGRPYSVTYNGTTYFYVLNLQGDVIQIVSSSGTVQASYTYDAWGNILSSSGTLSGMNPLRYRGYVYDRESGLYYLNSRYYDPANRRFISADGTDVLAIEQGSVVQFNLFAYCLNNPVQCIDSEGQLGTLATAALIGGITGAVWGGISAAMTGDNIFTGALAGAASGAVAGAFSSIQGIHFLAKGVVTGVANAVAYWNSTNESERNGGVAFVAFATGFIGGSWSAYVAPPGTSNFVSAVATYVSTGPSSVLTGIAQKTYHSSNSKRVNGTNQIAHHVSIVKQRRSIRPVQGYRVLVA